MKLPFLNKQKITSAYGYRINGTEDFHYGLDIVSQGDGIVRAPCNATVLTSTMIVDKSNRTWEWGNYVALYSHEDDIVIYLCHMAERYVKAGQKVVSGQPVGLMGNTGYSFGAHTHFEVRKNGVAINPCGLLGIENKANRVYVNSYNEEDEEMTGEEIYKKLTEYLNSLPESKWSQDEGYFAKATEEGVMDGKNPRGLMTREQLAAVLGRKDLL